MSGYRDRSNFDPNAGGEGAPLRPFNRWQWVGVAMMVAGALAMLATIAVRIGWRQASKDDLIPMGSTLVIFGSLLVGSRRQPGGLRSETKRKRMVIIAVGLMVFAAVIITILILKGA